MPVNGITGQIRENIKNAVPLMKKTVFGQDALIERIAATLRRQAAGLGDKNRPLGVYMVFGPPGNGKTKSINLFKYLENPITLVA